ncbi:PAS domain S-box protein [Halorussus halophilus]|uniref:PAS domain S-box protein n=1 Tax=Halorussus halophilus TaxID=2650975 RepID=UPI001300DD2B|nr:PAS domain S-box protein [Halorussus halophilus]
MTTSDPSWGGAAHLTSILDRTTDAVFAFDDEWRYVYVNAVGDEMSRQNVGLSSDDLLGEVLWDVLPELKETELYERGDEAMETQQPVTFEEAYDPTESWFEVRLFPSPEGLSVHVRDVTEQKQLEADKRAVEREKEATLDRVSDTVWALDEECRYTYLNQGARELAREWGSSNPEELVGTVVWEAFPDATDLCVYEAVNRAFDTQQRVEIIDHLDKIDRCFETQIYPSPSGVTIYSRDVTEQKRRESELEQYERILDTITDGVCVLDEEANFVLVNDAFVKLVGHTRLELLDADLSLLVGDETMRRAQEMRNEMSPGESETVEVEHRVGGAALDFEVQLTPFPVDGELTGTVGVVRDVSERKQLEAELDEITDRITDGFYALTPDWRVVYWNDEMEHRLGVSSDEIVGENILDVFPELRENVAYTRFVEAMETQEASTFQSYAPRWDKWTEISVYPSEAGLSIYSRDITERKARERELGETKERLELALAGTETGVWERDVGTDEIVWDETVERIFGLEPGTFEETYDAFLDYVHPEDRTPLQRATEQALEADETLSVEYRITREDGTRRWIESRGNVHHNEDGCSDRFVGVLRDVTEQKERERDLEQYETIVETASDGIYALDPQLRFTMVNDAFVEMTGYDYEELLGNDLSLVADSSAFEKGRALRDQLRDGDREVGVVADEMLRAGGTRLPVEARIALLETDDEYVGSVGVTRDVSERVVYERELEDRTERLESLIDSGPLVVYTLDPDGIFTLSEGAGLDRLGVERGEVVGQSVFDVYESYPEITDLHERALAGETVQRTVAVQDLVFDNTVRPIFGEDGDIERVVGVAFDITDRRRYEDALTALHGTAQKLLGVQTRADVYQEVLDAADDVADLPFTCIYVPDEEAGVLRPTMAATGVAEELEDPPTVPIEGSIVGTVYETREPTVFEDIHDSPELYDESYPSKSGMFVPLGDYGVLASGAQEPGVFDESARRLAELLAATAEAALDRIEHERELTSWAERLESVVENAPLLVYALDSDGQYTLLEGAGLDALGLETGEFVGQSVFETCADDERLVDAHKRALGGESVHAVAERRGLTFENWCRPIFDGDEVVRVIGVGLDITERAQYEDALAALHRSSRDLLHARTDDDVATKVVEGSDEILDLTGVVVYLFDEDETLLRPVAHSEDVPLLVGEPPAFGPESSIVWNTFVTGETASFDDVRDSEDVANENTSIRSGLYIPLGNHGVLTVISPEVGFFDEQTAELVDLFATTAETSLDRVAREQAIKDHQWELQQQASRLEQLNEITEQLRRVERVLVFESSRADIEQAVCEQLTASDRFSFAWIGEQTDGGVEPRTWAGNELGYLDSATCSDEPATNTLRTREPTVVENVADGLRSEPWRSEALSRGFQSVISVPLVYDELVYGVLSVYATRADGFDPMFQTVFAELGDTIAHAIDAAEAKQGLLTDDVVELDLRIPRAADPLARLARETGGVTRFEGLVPGVNGERLFFSVADASVDSVIAAAESSVVVSSIRVVSDREESSLFEMTVDGPLLATVLSDHGAVPHEIETDGDQTRVVVELSRAVDVRSFVEALRVRYPETELAARRDHERSLQTRETFRDDVDAAMTDRQHEVLQTAYLSGYFDTPRQSTGEEVAAVLGITQPTFANHLRGGERKLFELLYGS